MCCYFFNHTATPVIYTYSHTLSLHDALPITASAHQVVVDLAKIVHQRAVVIDHGRLDLAPISDLAQPRFAPVAPGVDLALVVGAQHWFAMFGRVEALAVDIADRGLAATAAAPPLAETELVRRALHFEEQRLDLGSVRELLPLYHIG